MSVTHMSRRDSRVTHTGSHGVSHTTPTRPDPTRPINNYPRSGFHHIVTLVTRETRQPRDEMVTALTRHCESCGRFIKRDTPRTAFYAYEIDLNAERVVYSLGTATRLVERLLCPGCSTGTQCHRLREAGRDHGIAIDRRLPNGWAEVAPEATA